MGGIQKEQIMKKIKIFSLLVIIVVIAISSSSCQNGFEAYSVSNDRKLVSLENLVYAVKSGLESLDLRIGEISSSARTNKNAIENLSNQVDRNFELLQTVYASVTYMSFINTPPDMTNYSSVPSLEEIELLINSRMKENLNSGLYSNTTKKDGTEDYKIDSLENEYLKNKVDLLQSEIEILKQNYASLKWQTYKNQSLSADPYSLEDSSLIFGGKVEYRIQSGDTLSEISRAFLGSAGMTDKIMSDNGINDPRSIIRGNVLTLEIPDFKERIKIPVYGKYEFKPETIACFFGESTSDGFSRGLTLSLTEESDIIPILPGKVIDTGPGYVVVYHGNELKTIYSMMDSVNVQKGQFVTSEDRIGKCGSGYFKLEAIINSEYRDPLLLFLNRMGDFSITFYTEWDDGNLPFFPYFRRTKAGSFAREWYTVAADTAILPPGSIIYIPELKNTPSRGVFFVEDTGSAIKGNKLDIYIRDLVEASKLKTNAEIFKL